MVENKSDRTLINIILVIDLLIGIYSLIIYLGNLLSRGISILFLPILFLGVFNIISIYLIKKSKYSGIQLSLFSLLFLVVILISILILIPILIRGYAYYTFIMVIILFSISVIIYVFFRIYKKKENLKDYLTS